MSTESVVTTNWHAMPENIFRLILKASGHEDIIRMRVVCKSWKDNIDAHFTYSRKTALKEGKFRLQSLSVTRCQELFYGIRFHEGDKFTAAVQKVEIWLSQFRHLKKQISNLENKYLPQLEICNQTTQTESENPFEARLKRIEKSIPNHNKTASTDYLTLKPLLLSAREDLKKFKKLEEDLTCFSQESSNNKLSAALVALSEGFEISHICIQTVVAQLLHRKLPALAMSLIEYPWDSDRRAQILSIFARNGHPDAVVTAIFQIFDDANLVFIVNTLITHGHFAHAIEIAEKSPSNVRLSTILYFLRHNTPREIWVNQAREWAKTIPKSEWAHYSGWIEQLNSIFTHTQTT
jgi:hypothetical protein